MAKLYIEGLQVIAGKETEKGKEVSVVFVAKEGGKGKKDLPFRILINGKEAEDINGERIFKTDENGLGNVTLTTNEPQVRASVFIPERAILKHSGTVTLKKEAKKEKVGSSFIKMVTPEVAVKVANLQKIIDDSTCNTKEILRLLNEWLDKKTLAEKSWFLNVLANMDPQKVGPFMDRFVHLPDTEKDKTARNTGLLPVIDIMDTFSKLLLSVPKNQVLIDWLDSLDPEDHKNFMVNITHLPEATAINILKKIKKSPDKTKLAKTLGLLNKIKK